MPRVILSLDTIGSKQFASQPGGQQALARLCDEMDAFTQQWLDRLRPTSEIRTSKLPREGDDIGYAIEGGSPVQLADTSVAAAIAAFLAGPNARRFRFTAYEVSDARYQPLIGAFKSISKGKPGSAHHLAFDRRLVTALSDESTVRWLAEAPTEYAALDTPGEGLVGVIVDYYCPIDLALEYAPPPYLRDSVARANARSFSPVDQAHDERARSGAHSSGVDPRGRDSEIDRLCELGEVQLHRKLWSDARQTFQDGLARADTLGLPIARARLLTHLGRVAAAEQRTAEALALYEQALVANVDAHSRHGEAVVHGRIADLLERSDTARAAASRLRAVEIETALGDSLSLVYAANAAGRFFRGVGNLELAAKMHLQAAVVAERIGHNGLAARNYGNHGSALRDLGLLDAATEAYRTALQLSESSRLWYGVSITLDNLGRVLAMGGDDEQAARHFQRSLELDRLKGDALGMGKSTANIGVLCWLRGDHSAAVSQWRDATRLLESALSRGGGIETEARRGLSKLGRMRKAIKTVRKGNVGALFL